jgi:hypothetical protein
MDLNQIRSVGLGGLIALIVLLVCIILMILGQTLTPFLVLLLIGLLALARLI